MRLHPEDIALIVKGVAEELRRPVVTPGRIPVSAISAGDLEARLRSEGRVHRSSRSGRKLKH